MKIHPLAVCGFLILGAAVLFGTQPAWTQDRTVDEPAVAPAGDESEPADTGMEESADQGEAPAEVNVEETAVPGGEPESGGKSIVPSGETETAPAETMEAPSGQAEEGLPAPGEVAVEAPSKPGETIRYTVKPGDTLWDITRSIWSDPFLWPKAWKNNPQIFNPDLIYPGNVLEFPPDLSGPVKAAEAAPAPAEEAPPAMEEAPAAEEEAPPAEEEAAVTEEPEVPVVAAPVAPPKEPDFAELASNGFVLKGNEAQGTVVGGKDAREMFGKHDTVYIRPNGGTPLAVGDRVILSRNVRKVYHPVTHRYIGDLIHVLGVAEITEDQEKIKKAKVTESYDYISLNDSAIPYQTMESSVSAGGDSAMAAAEGSDRGYILDVKEDHLTNAVPDVVYLDRGMNDGLEKGSRFDVIRSGRSISGNGNLPSRKVGRVEVLMALGATSTAKVIQSTEPIRKGDRYEPVSQP
jgi:hypothetical protein